jgi:hypothetical protein
LLSHKGHALLGVSAGMEEWVLNAHQSAQQAASAPDDPEQLVPHHHHEGEQAFSASTHSTRQQHIWQYRHIYCLETLTHPCGCIIAWTKYTTSESPTNILNTLEQVFPDLESQPSYIVIDKACRILAMLMSRGEHHTWFQTSRFLVDVFHFKNHRNDPTCQRYCNPSPSVQNDPNLVIPIQDAGNGQTRVQRAFNTEAAEQLNAWFGGYASQLSHMHAANHDFLVHVMLTYRFHAKSSN